jgi:hypothetical protein
MKRIVIVFSVIIVILLVGIFYLYTRSANQTGTIVSSPAPITVAPSNSTYYCVSKDLQSSLSLSPGAGNIYGTLTIKNISGKPCQIIGNNFITANYDMQTIKNISLEHVGTPESALFQLSPNQTIYSQVHYPNGPQCSTGILTAKVIFRYAVSATDIVNFADENGTKEQNVTICNSPAEITTMQIWNMSSQPITP